MENDGLLDSGREEGGDRPARKVYRVTQKGRECMTESVLTRLSAPRFRTSDFDLALAYLWILPVETAIAALEANAAGLEDRLSHVGGKQERDESAGMPVHVRALFDHSLEMIRSEKEWIEKWIQILKNEVKK